MKKNVIGILCVLVLSLTIFNIKSQEFFVKIDQIKQVKPVSENVETTQKSEKPKTVRIVLKNNNGNSIYHSNVKLKSKNLNVYYGKNYKTKKFCKKIEIAKDSKYFKKSNVIKIDCRDKIQWTKEGAKDSVSYQGMFYIYNTKEGLVVVNRVDMEDYVAGVIASEIGENSPGEALKAQAVCARTFISKSNPKEYKKYKANGDDSVSYQVYNKVTAGKNCTKAAKETKNQIILYNGKPITAYYFSTSCGYTTDYKIWGRKKQNYLKGGCTLNSPSGDDIRNEKTFEKFIKSKPQSYESECPFYRWNVYLTKEQIQNAVSQVVGEDTGDIKKIEINSRGTGGIASQITIYGKNRQVSITNQNQIRKALCSYYGEIKLNDGSVRTKMEMLPSAFISIENIYDSGKLCGFKIYGGGFGHGSGMSQNGAREMAKNGMKYDEILKFFYNDIAIENY